MRMRLRVVAAFAAALRKLLFHARGSVLALALATTATVLVPTVAHAAGDGDWWPVEPTCVGQGVTTNGSTMSIHVTLLAVPPPVPPVPHRAWCNVYVNGSLVGSIEGDHIGFVIVGSGVISGVPVGVYSFCGGREGRDC